MIRRQTNIFLLTIFQIVIFIKAREEGIKGRDYGGQYLPAKEEEPKPDYQSFRYPPEYYYQINYDESNLQKNSEPNFLSKGLNFLMLNLGIIGAIKSIFAFGFMVFLVKIFVLTLKTAAVKSFLLLFLITPLLAYLNSNYPKKPGEEMAGEKPEDVPSDHDMMNSIYRNQNRKMNSNDITTNFWQSMRAFAESEQCAEKITCVLGASNNDSLLGNLFSMYFSVPILMLSA